VGVLTVNKGSGPGWTVRGGQGSVEILLSQPEMAAIGPAERGIAGYDLRLSIIDPGRALAVDLPRTARVVIIELRPELEVSLRSIALLKASHPHAKIVAAIRDPALPVVRSLLRAGVYDVVQLPLDRAEVTGILAQIPEDSDKAAATAPRGRVISVIKSVGGVGATSLLTQAAALYARKEALAGRETCLFDLDIQFGNAATYLGLAPALTVRDLLDTGSRGVDAALLRSIGARHGSGLEVFAAPTDMMPLEAIDGDEICDLIDLATQEFDTVFVDLPGSWTNWSLSVIARSNLVLLVTELSIASIRQARRVLDLIEQENLTDVKVQIVMNRVEKKLFGSISLRDASTALRRPISIAIGNEFRLMSSALDQGVLLSDIKAKNKLTRDLLTLIEGVDMLLAEEG
jgi:pilus assembly protein CpaE